MKTILFFVALLTLATELSGQVKVWPEFSDNQSAVLSVPDFQASFMHDFGFGLKALQRNQVELIKRVKENSTASLGVSQAGDEYLSNTDLAVGWYQQKGFAIISAQAKAGFRKLVDASSSVFDLNIKGRFELYPGFCFTLGLQYGTDQKAFETVVALNTRILERLYTTFSYRSSERYSELSFDIEFEIGKGVYLSAIQELLSQKWTLGVWMPIYDKWQMMLQYGGVTQLGQSQKVKLIYQF